MEKLKEIFGLIKRILEFEFIQTDNFTLSLYSIIAALIIIVGARAIVLTIKTIIFRTTVGGKKIDKSKAFTVVQLIKYFIYVIAFVLVIETMGANVSILIASSAALFVGIGLGLQNIFNDIVSGIFLLFERTVSVGDVVEIDNLVGRVKEIDIRTSRIRTRDGITMIVPNSKLIGQNVINWSTDNRTTRFNINVGVAYGSDTKKVRIILEQCAKEQSRIKKIPAPCARFIDFGDSSLDFELLIWVDETWEIEFIKSDLRFEIDKRFRESGIRIPFPQRDVHMIPQKTSE